MSKQAELKRIDPGGQRRRLAFTDCRRNDADDAQPMGIAIASSAASAPQPVDLKSFTARDDADDASFSPFVPGRRGVMTACDAMGKTSSPETVICNLKYSKEFRYL